MLTSVLWEPEEGRCAQCGTVHVKARTYTSGGSSTRFCAECWSNFMDECNVTHEPLRSGVASEWDAAVSFTLEFEGEPDADGAAQGTAAWN